MTKGENGANRSIMLADVKTPFLYGDARRSLYAELPPENPLPASGRHVGKLERAMYGTRDAPMTWQDHVRETLRVHVDDLLCTGVRDDLMWLKKHLLKKYELETLFMGEDNDMVKKAVYLSRTLE